MRDFGGAIEMSLPCRISLMSVPSQQEKEAYARLGFHVARGLFSAEETQRFRDHYMEMNRQDRKEARDGVSDPSDPLAAFPRIMQPHRYDELSLGFLLDSRLEAIMSALLGRSPYAVQTMVYFKPAGARGQALHQDQRYLQVRPGTCMAAWLALDRCDDENGCLRVVPGSHELPLLCPQTTDTTMSFVAEEVPTPQGMEVVDVVMEPGDVLFFNGALIHGSGPNKSTDRFRRSLIAHYVEGDSRSVSHYYFPALRFDGSVVDLESTSDGSQCGVFVDRDGHEVMELIPMPATPLERH